MANFRSPFFQNIVFFSFNHFEISVWAEVFTPMAPGDLENLSAAQIEPMFLQSIALYRVSLSLGLDFIDFSRFCRVPGDIVQFAVRLPFPAPPVFSKANRLKEVLRPFLGNPHFCDLNEGNHMGFFYRLSGKYTFNENLAYIYRFDDFNGGFLHSYPMGRLKSGANIRIHIKTPGPVQKRMAKQGIINHLVVGSETMFLADVNLESAGTNSLNHVFAGLVRGLPPHHAEDFITIIDQLALFLQQSSYTAMLLLVDRLNKKPDAEFLNYLLEAPGIPNILLICFDATEGIMSFDLELNENPVNWVAEYFGYGRTEMDANEIRVLKTIATIPVSVPWNRLHAFFPTNDVVVIETLVRRKQLRVSSGKVLLGNTLPALNLEITRDEENLILESFLKTEAATYPGVRIGYLIRTKQLEELKATLKEYLESDTGFDVEFPDWETLVSKNSELFLQDMEIAALVLGVLVEGNNTAAARVLVDMFHITDVGDMPQHKSEYFGHFLLFAARLCHVEKDHLNMGKWLDAASARWGRNIPKLLVDPFHYLKFLSLERKSDKDGANRHFKSITSELYKKRASLLKSDRYIYGGRYARAEHLLQETGDFFNRHHFTWDEIETRNQQAKLARQRAAFAEAEKVYKNIFLKSEMKNYPLLSAYIAVDLGNLYWTQDNFNRANTWYRKALRLCQEQGNINGINTVEFNLAEITKIDGHWEETKSCLESIIKHDKEHGTVASLAVDYYNIAHLEFLKHNISQALECLENASTLFKQKENVAGLVECEILKLQIELLRENGVIDWRGLKKLVNEETLEHDLKIALSVMEMVAEDTARRNGAVIARIAVSFQSRTVQYQWVAALLHRYRSSELLDLLKILSMDLSKDAKNYYFYEYYYIFYSYFYSFDPSHSLQTDGSDNGSETERNQFTEVYYFFLRNGRTPAPGIAKNKQVLDDRTAAYNLFKCVELVEDYQNWQIPEDFFNSLVFELRKMVPVDLLRLCIYERGDGTTANRVNSETTRPLFDFSKTFSGSHPFRELTGEIMEDAYSRLEQLTLTPDTVKKMYHCREKVFYVFNLTRVILWKLSESLFGVLLLAFDNPGYNDQDFYPRHNEFLQNFGILIHRYYDTVYRLNLKLGFIIGESPAVKKLKEQILKVSKVDFSLLIRGESGSGKELVAKAVHLLSQRSGQPFVAVNAAAIPENLLEAELFGYKKGAFTGANENKTGLIESASCGTLFLDEIADLSINLQAKMLRVLQEKEIRRLGENKTISVDIRLVCATNKDLKQLILSQQFREDLFFRIQDLTIQVPPLRERIEDIPLLVCHFLKKYSFTITDKKELQRIFYYFCDRTWTGNIRELESSVKRLITYYPDFEMECQHMPLSTGTSLNTARDQLEESMVIKALKDNRWNKIEAAASLKISRQYLFKLIKKYKIVTISP